VAANAHGRAGAGRIFMATLEELQAQVTEQAASIEALVKKNKELIEEKRSTKTGAELHLAEARDKIDDLQAQLDKISRESEKAIKAALKDRDDHAAALDGERAAVSKLLIDTGIDAALDKAKVLPQYKAAVKALIREQGVTSIESEGDIRRAVATVKKDGKDVKLSLDDLIAKEFAASEQGKAFFAAEGSAGAGAQGGAGKGAAGRKTLSESEFLALEQGARMEFSKAGGRIE
jgi:phage I-like protein